MESARLARDLANAAPSAIPRRDLDRVANALDLLNRNGRETVSLLFGKQHRTDCRVQADDKASVPLDSLVGIQLRNFDSDTTLLELASASWHSGVVANLVNRGLLKPASRWMPVLIATIL